MYTGGHRVSLPLAHVSVSKRDQLLYRDPGWRLLENGVAMATASRERCYLVCGVTLLMEEGGRVGWWVWGSPKEGDEGESRSLKLESVSSESRGSAQAERDPAE